MIDPLIAVSAKLRLGSFTTTDMNDAWRLLFDGDDIPEDMPAQQVATIVNQALAARGL